MSRSNDPQLEFDSPFPQAVCIRHFREALTYFHSAAFAPPDQILRVCLPKGRHLIQPTMALHGDHVLLLKRFHFPLSGRGQLAKSLSTWLGERGFAVEGTHRLFRTTTITPIEDGFFACLAVIHEAMKAPSDFSAGLLEWKEVSPRSNEMGGMLLDFVEDEVQRIGDPSRSLDDLYQNREECPPARRIFDTEYAHLEFATSVLSANELRFWSRPVNCPP